MRKEFGEVVGGRFLYLSMHTFLILFAGYMNKLIVALLVISTLLGVIVVGPLMTLAVVIYSK